MFLYKSAASEWESYPADFCVFCGEKKKKKQRPCPTGVDCGRCFSCIKPLAMNHSYQNIEGDSLVQIVGSKLDSFPPLGVGLCYDGLCRGLCS